MGIQCSKQKHRPSDQNEIRVSIQSQKSASTSKEAIAYCDSAILANYMRTKPDKTFLAEVIQKQSIQLDSCEKLAEVIESKSEILLRCYNDYTEKALKIKLKVLEYYKKIYQVYKNLGNDITSNVTLISNETMQLLLETLIILNCLMDKNFDDEQEVWWGDDYFNERIQRLELTQDTSTLNDKIVAPILLFINALKNKITQCLPNIQKQLSLNQQQSVANSVVIASDHLTKFYDKLKLDLEFGRNFDEEQISH